MKVEETEVHKIANKNNIDIYYPTKIDETIIQKIKSLKPDLVIVIAYGIILPEKFLEIPKHGCINIHVSLLPRWRGAAPIEHALLAGDDETGISIISLSSELDAGDILLDEKLTIDKNVYSDELTLYLSDLGQKSMMKVLPNIFENKILPKKQDKNEITYAKKFSSDDRKINFNLSSEKVFNHIRAHGPKPGSWFLYNGERIKILKAIKVNQVGKKSTILSKNFHLSCDDGSILPTLIQREGKKPVSLEQFLLGFTFSVNDQLNA